jgi:hypothetical protein
MLASMKAEDSVIFAWIHLSDIHFGHGDAAHGWDQQLVLAVLRRDVGATTKASKTGCSPRSRRRPTRTSIPLHRSRAANASAAS